MKLTYLYRCFDGAGQLLYAGITDDWEARRRSHAKDKFWWGDVVRVDKMAMESRQAALWAEWAVITTCRPTYNKQILIPAVPTFAPPETFTDEDDYETWGPLTGAMTAMTAIGRLLRPRSHPEPAVEVELPEVRMPRVATTVRRGPVPERKPAPAPVANREPELWAPAVTRPPRPAPVFEPAAKVNPPSFTVDLQRARVRTFEMVGQASQQGVVDGVLAKRLADEGMVVPLGTVAAWLREWVRTGVVERTSWDTFKLPTPPDPDEPIPTSS